MSFVLQLLFKYTENRPSLFSLLAKMKRKCYLAKITSEVLKKTYLEFRQMLLLEILCKKPLTVFVKTLPQRHLAGS